MAEIENQAWKIDNRGVITTWNDHPFEDFFETDKLSTSHITDEFFMGYYESGPFDVFTTETHYGHIFDYPGVYSDEVRLVSGNDSFDNAILLPGYTALSSLHVGATGRFIEHGYFRISGNQVVDIIEGDITLASISEQNPLINPVPEPASILLFGAGLIGLADTRIRNRKR